MFSVPPTVFRDLLFALLAVAAVLPATAWSRAPQPATNQSPSTNQTPANASAAVPQDPAAVVFETDVGLVLHAVKAASATDYEAAILALKEALAAADDSDTRVLARAWRMYKATEPDAKSSVIYVHLIDPVVAGVDYRPSLWLDKLLNGAPADMLAKYRDAFAVPPSKLSLREVTKPKPEPEPEP